MNATPTLENLSASDNALGDHITLRGGTLSSDVTWDYTGLPIHLTADFTVGAEATLDIAPGTAVKIPQGAFFRNSGTLNAVGTTTDPVIFTTVLDDSAG